MGIGDPAWAARQGGGVPRSRHTQPPSPGPSVGRVGPRTYVAPYITNQHYGTVISSLHPVATAMDSLVQCLSPKLSPASNGDLQLGEDKCRLKGHFKPLRLSPESRVSSNA